ncbi:ABC transporter ATP-binding protein [Bacillus alveayuensis]|uniref:ABC transporter ATP-binding protein n=1 Tax=Aeribacillus alveayuensis TaxID=279215 RepID=UPI000B245A51|nr:ABC transporter ATP-binding protein [Bacillus alveayuensis]
MKTVVQKILQKTYKRIIYMEDGEIKAMGSHHELMKDCPEYNNLYTLQASSFNG